MLISSGAKRALHCRTGSALRHVSVTPSAARCPTRSCSFRGKAKIDFSSATLSLRGGAKFAPPTKAAPAGEIVVTVEAFKGEVSIGSTTMSGDPKKVPFLVSRVVAWATAAELRAKASGSPIS